MFPLATTILSEIKANVSFSVYALIYFFADRVRAKDAQKGKKLHS